MQLNLLQELMARSYISEKVKANPSRFAAFAAVSMHDPKQAAEELSRAVIELGCVGVMLNDFQSSGPDGNVSYLTFLEDPPNEYCGRRRCYFTMTRPMMYASVRFKTWCLLCLQVFWAAVEELDVLVYMHPRLASKRIFDELYRDRKWLQASAWGFANQLSIHILGIATSGVFDRFPGVQLAFGHMGEHVRMLAAPLFMYSPILFRSRSICGGSTTNLTVCI
jgi:2,3-dihydroxybenzoate decarboxylase